MGDGNNMYLSLRSRKRGIITTYASLLLVTSLIALIITFNRILQEEEWQDTIRARTLELNAVAFNIDTELRHFFNVITSSVITNMTKEIKCLDDLERIRKMLAESIEQEIMNSIDRFLEGLTYDRGVMITINSLKVEAEDKGSIKVLLEVSLRIQDNITHITISKHIYLVYDTGFDPDMIINNVHYVHNVITEYLHGINASTCSDINSFITSLVNNITSIIYVKYSIKPVLSTVIEEEERFGIHMYKVTLSFRELVCKAQVRLYNAITREIKVDEITVNITLDHVQTYYLLLIEVDSII